MRGCNGSRKWHIGRHDYYGCPQKLLDRSFRQAMMIWARWKRYGWPDGGGWADQPAQMFDVVDALETECNAIEADKMERARHGNR